MNWYYAEDGKQAGPVDDAQLEGLVQAGRIQPETLVWREGMSDWQPYGQVASHAPAAAPPVATALDGNEAVCAECGRIFSKNNMIRHGDTWVCATCKPVFLQKLREGAAVRTGQLNYAGFWLRFAAVFVDGILLWVVNFVISMIAGLSFGQATGVEQPTGLIVLQLVLLVIQIAIALSYEVVMIGKYGATLGKMACRIKVVTAEGDRVSYGRALGRYFAKILSGMICAIGYIMAGFDEEKRALHDRICNTRVVYK